MVARKPFATPKPSRPATATKNNDWPAATTSRGGGDGQQPGDGGDVAAEITAAGHDALVDDDDDDKSDGLSKVVPPPGPGTMKRSMSGKRGGPAGTAGKGSDVTPRSTDNPRSGVKSPPPASVGKGGRPAADTGGDKGGAPVATKRAGPPPVKPSALLATKGERGAQPKPLPPLSAPEVNHANQSLHQAVAALTGTAGNTLGSPQKARNAPSAAGGAASPATHAAANKKPLAPLPSRSPSPAKSPVSPAAGAGAMASPPHKLKPLTEAKSDGKKAPATNDKGGKEGKKADEEDEEDDGDGEGTKGWRRQSALAALEDSDDDDDDSEGSSEVRNSPFPPGKTPHTLTCSCSLFYMVHAPWQDAEWTSPQPKPKRNPRMSIIPPSGNKAVPRRLSVLAQYQVQMTDARGPIHRPQRASTSWTPPSHSPPRCTLCLVQEKYGAIGSLGGLLPAHDASKDLQHFVNTPATGRKASVMGIPHLATVTEGRSSFFNDAAPVPPSRKPSVSIAMRTSFEPSSAPVTPGAGGERKSSISFNCHIPPEVHYASPSVRAFPLLAAFWLP